MQKLSDEQLRAKTDEFRARIQERSNSDSPTSRERAMTRINTDRQKEIEAQRNEVLKEVLDELLEEAFAVCREAGKRVLNMRHFDVQLIGGMVLHEGKIAEMKTGEGKTLVATLPVYLNALSGRGVHVVTVNDYLAKRDSEWMGKLYGFLGLTRRRDRSRPRRRRAPCRLRRRRHLRHQQRIRLRLSARQHEVRPARLRAARAQLRHRRRSRFHPHRRSPHPAHHFGRQRRIDRQVLQGQSHHSQARKGRRDRRRSRRAQDHTGDFVVDEKHRNITVTDEGWEKVERLLGIGNIADPENWDLKHHVETAVKAHALYKRDVEYVVKDGEVIIVDEFTGRLMPGRRWSDGLHQAVEAKENVKIERENQTLATITFQNYFRMYKKLAGMTGTAETEAAEFDKIYSLEVVVIPDEPQPLLRIENPDVVYRTEKEKYFAAADEIQRLHESGQPVLVGTTSIEKSERLSDLLKKKGIKHVRPERQVPRARSRNRRPGRPQRHGHHRHQYGRSRHRHSSRRQSRIHGQAGMREEGNRAAMRAAQGKIKAEVDDTEEHRLVLRGQRVRGSHRSVERDISTRYKAETDQEHNEVIAAGGLHIFGTERHEARRIDNQLRGRAGRQGDPGSSRFYLSLEDDLMRIFAKEWVSNLLQRLGMEEGVPIESRMISRRIEAAQKAVEGQNFEARKHLLEYDDVMNKQREAVYGLRRRLLEGLDQKDLIIEDYVSGILGDILDTVLPAERARR